MKSEPGRFCPVSYRYQPSDLGRVRSRPARTLYLVGGLYGNRPALRIVLELAGTESDMPVICFNGDFNWFNTNEAGYQRINETVLAHTALRGNVETELASGVDGAGCGCAYPDWVDGNTVERSNIIMAHLQQVAARYPELTRRLTTLPMYAVFTVGGRRVAVVHGDAESLAGWGFAQETIDQNAQRSRIGQWFDTAQADIFACTHTCLPVLRRFDDARIVVNNGAAGMPNFGGTHYGVMTRIATTPSPFEALYGCELNGVYIDALAVDYPQQEWLDEFLSNWPPDSAAHLSYFDRFTNGPDYSLTDAYRSPLAPRDL